MPFLASSPTAALLARNGPDQGDRMGKQMTGHPRTRRDRRGSGALPLPSQLLLVALSHKLVSGS